MKLVEDLSCVSLYRNYQEKRTYQCRVFSDNGTGVKCNLQNIKPVCLKCSPLFSSTQLLKIK